jgi:DNA anti-recombination protein RmuC
MKKHLIKSLLLSFVILLAISACNKEFEEFTPELRDEAVPSLTSLVEIANLKYLSGEVEIDNQDVSFFVANDGLIDEYTATEHAFMSADKQAVANSFATCLRSIELDPDQKPRVRRLMKLYENRNERIISNHRMLAHQLRDRMETARRTLHMQYRNERITEDEFRTRIAALRERYQQSLQRIRSSNAEAFSRSYELLLQRLQEVLTEEQWEAFSDCISS